MLLFGWIRVWNHGTRWQTYPYMSDASSSRDFILNALKLSFPNILYKDTLCSYKRRVRVYLSKLVSKLFISNFYHLQGYPSTWRERFFHCGICTQWNQIPRPEKFTIRIFICWCKCGVRNYRKKLGRHFFAPIALYSTMVFDIHGVWIICACTQRSM